jgi:amino acid adenylation domain-containing protein/thioester reductase-like protein
MTIILSDAVHQTPDDQGLWFRKYLSSSTATAAIFQEKTLSYAELTSLSFLTAVQLIEQYDVKPGKFIGLMMEPGLDLLVAIHGIWLTGSAFVSLDPKLPVERLRHMLDNAEIDVVVTQPQYLIDISLMSRALHRKLSTFQVPAASSHVSCFPEKCSIQEQQPAYMIYTSGSTGLPKGVLCSHKGVANLCTAVKPLLDLNVATRHLQFASISFDASIWEIFPTLYAGGTVIFATREQLLPGKRLAMLIQSQEVTHLCLPPSILGKLNNFVDELSTLRVVTMAGEACPPSLAHHWLRKTRRVFNAYGPTESTVCATIHEIQSDDSKIPIGKALFGIQTYVVNCQNQLCGPNQPGELWVGGKGLALGYHRRPDLTADRFVNAPGRDILCYRTGDRVIQDENGELHFLGRTDHQVKVRGFRIELEAIEHILHKYPGIAGCAVKIFARHHQDDTESKSIVAYYCADRSKVFEVDLRKFMAEHLPEYMLPHYYFLLSELPMMPNLSKINREALPAPETFFVAQKSVVVIENSVVGAGSDALTRLCSLFDQTLQLPLKSTNANTDFFKTGGDSLSVAHLLNQIEKEFSVTLPSRLVYEHPTPQSLLIVCLAYAEHGCESLVPSPESVVSSLLKESDYSLPSTTLVSSDDISQLSSLPSCVLLTGATGFLGSHLLCELLQTPSLRTIYCVVRATDDDLALLRINQTFIRFKLPTCDMTRLVVYAGDITEPHLGLYCDCYQQLAKQVDTIIHAAADISYIRPYSEALKPNIKGTRSLLDFAALHRIKAFHYVSSLAVYGATATLLGLDIVDEEHDIRESLPILFFENGYTKAKWVAESMVKNAQTQGLPVSIYRPGFIQGHSHNGVSNTEDLFCRLLIGNIQLGLYPDFPHKYWLPVPIDYVSKAMAHIVLTQPVGKTYNLMPGRHQEPSNNEIFALIARFCPMQRVPCREWIKALSQLTADNALYPLVRFLSENVYYDRRTILESHHYTSSVLANNTLKALQGTSIVCPDIDKAYIKQLLSYFVQEQLLSSCDISDLEDDEMRPAKKRAVEEETFSQWTCRT